MNDMLKGWLVPRPVFAPDDDAGAVVEKVDAAAAGADTGDKDDAAAAAADDAVVTDDKASDVVAADAGDKAGGLADDKGDADKTDDADDATTKPGLGITDELRDAIAGDDPALRKLLTRHTTLRSLAQALKNAQAKISTGKVQTEKPDPKDEKAVAEWRKSRGIPDDAAGYALPEAVTKAMTDEDKPLIAAFTEFAHARDADPSAVNVATEWYFDMVGKMAEDAAAADNAAKEKADDHLRQEWGREFKANMRLGTSYLETIPGVGKSWAEARLADGRRLGDVPEFVTWAAEMGRVEFGDPTFATTDSVERHGNRIAEIEKIRDTDFERYEREGLDKEMVGLREKELKRGKAA